VTGVAPPLLELSGVSRVFGGLKAVDGVDLSLAPGARAGLIGPNGAGKSTLFRLITGAMPVSSGSLRFDGADVTRLPEHRRARAGIAQTFQHSSLFPSLPCRDNVVLALQRVRGDGGRLRRRRGSAIADDADALLERTGLGDRADALSAALSHGERRQLEVAVALACSPRLLLLDEPAAGMSPAETGRLAEIVEGLPSDLTVLVIEHDLDFVFRVAREITVLHLGAVIERGTTEQVRASEEVERVYLGGVDADDLFVGGGP
jgi:branched-chain amino acid transport system ATP-binding protein